MSQNEFYVRVAQISNRSGMYLINNVEELQLYLMGFMDAMKQDEWLLAFDNYVNEYHGVKGEQIPWYRLIRLRSGSDIHSLELFRLLFEQFCELNQIELSK